MSYRTRPTTLRAIFSGIIESTPTEYRGITMRSKLEVDFARHLDGLGIEWRYEPAIYGPKGDCYLPDFRVDREDGPHFFEVKPTLREAAEAMRRMSSIRDTHPNATLVVVVAEGSNWIVCEPGGSWFAWQERWKHAA